MTEKRSLFLPILLVAMVICITSALTADNLANGNFNSGNLNYWNSWNFNANSVSGVVGITNRYNVLSDTAFISLNGSGYGEGVIYQSQSFSLGAYSGQIISFGGFFKTKNIIGDIKAYIRFDYRDSNGNLLNLAHDVVLILPDAKWEFKSSADIVPNDPRIARVYYSIVLMGSGSGSLYFDDMMSPVEEPVAVRSYLKDPGFETGKLDFWQHSAANQNLRIGVTNYPVVRGGHSAYFTFLGGDSSGSIWQSDSTVLPGQSVSFGAFFKSENLNNINLVLKLDYRDADGNSLSLTQDSPFSINGTNWQFKKISGLVPNDSRIKKVFYSIAAQGSGIGKFFIDDSICPVIFPERNMLMSGEILENFDGISEALSWQNDPAYALDRNNNEHYKSFLMYRGIADIGFIKIAEDSRPRAMRVKYSKSQAEQGFWMNGHMNMKDYDYFSFWIYNNGEPLSFSVSLKDSANVIWNSASAGVVLRKETAATGWINVVLQLNKINNTGLNLSAIQSIGFIADPDSSSASGTFWLDDIMLSQAPDNAAFETFEGSPADWSSGWEPSVPLGDARMNVTRKIDSFHNDWYYPNALGQASLCLEWINKPADYSFIRYNLKYNAANVERGKRGNYTNLKLNNNHILELWVQNLTEPKTVVPVLMKFDGQDVGVQYLSAISGWQKLVWDYQQITSANNVENIYFLPFPGQSCPWGAMNIDDLNFTGGTPPVKIQPPINFTLDSGKPNNTGVIKFNWAYADHATSYRIQESTTSNFISSTVTTYSIVGTAHVINHDPITQSGTYYYRICSVYSNQGENEWSSFSAPKSVNIQPKLIIRLGEINNSDNEFLSGAYPETAINLDTQPASQFPKELNTWQPRTFQQFYFNLTQAEADQGLIFKITPAWMDQPSSSYNIALEIRHSKGWDEVAVREIGGEKKATVRLAVSSKDLYAGRNDFRLRIVGTNGLIQAITWDQILIESGGMGSAYNNSYSTLCAEEDNGNVPIYFPGTKKFRLEATIPEWLPSDVLVKEANFDYAQSLYIPKWTAPDYNVPKENPGYGKDDLVNIFDNGQFYIKARYVLENPLPMNSMTITCSKGNGVYGDIQKSCLSNAQFIVVGRKIPGPNSTYPQMLVLYYDGNLRLLPLPLTEYVGTEKELGVVFGASVLIGPTKEEGRPVSPISRIDISILGPCSQADSHNTFFNLFITFDDGSTRKAHVVSDSITGRPYLLFDLQNISDNTTDKPVSTMRSMWVRDGMSDSDRVATRQAYYAPIGWDKLVGDYFWFPREVATYKNTHAPDIRVENLDEAVPFLIREAESFDRVCSSELWNFHYDSDASGEKSFCLLPAGGWAEYDINIMNPLSKVYLQVRYADDWGGNQVKVYVDGIETTQFTAMSTGSWSEYEYSRKILLGDLLPGKHIIRISTENQVNCYGVVFDSLELSTRPLPEKTVTIFSQQAESGVSGSGYEIGNWSNAEGGQSADIGGTLGTGGSISYAININRDYNRVYLNTRYAQALGLSEVDVYVDGKNIATLAAESTADWNTFRKSGNYYIGDLTAGAHAVTFSVHNATDNPSEVIGHQATKGAVHLDQFKLVIYPPVECDVRYLDPLSYDGKGRAVWSIGSTMQYELRIKNTTQKPINNLSIKVNQEYYDNSSDLMNNYLLNPDFETGSLTPWGVWTSDNNILKNGITSVVAHSGVYSTYMTATGNGSAQGTIYQVAGDAVIPGQTVAFGAYIKSLNLSGMNVAIRFDYRDSNGSWLNLVKDVNLNLSGSSDWKFLSGSDIVPNDSRIAKINYSIFMGCSSGSTGTIYVDDATSSIIQCAALQNPGFETGSMDSWGVWSSDTGVISGGITSAAAHSGTSSSFLTISGNGSAEGIIYQISSQSVTPGQKVALGGYIKSLNLSGASARIRFDYRDINDNWLNLIKDVNLNLSGSMDWQFLSGMDVVPNDLRIKKIHYTIFLSTAGNGSGTVYIDDTTSSIVECAVLPNSGFETGSLAPWGVWSSDNNVISGGITTAAAHNGSHSSALTITGNGSAEGTIYQIHSAIVTAGQDIAFGAYLKSLNLSGASVRIRFDYRDAAGAWLNLVRDVYQYLPSTADWQFKSASDIVPADSRIAKVNYSIYLSTTGNGSGTLYMDDTVLSTVPVIHKGDVLPGNSLHTYLNQAIPANGTLLLVNNYTIPSDAQPGYNRTHVEIDQAGIGLYDNPEVGVWCPPVPTAVLSGKMRYKGKNFPSRPITIKLRKRKSNTEYTFNVMPNVKGEYTLFTTVEAPLPEGTYDLTVNDSKFSGGMKESIKIWNGRVVKKADFDLTESK